MASRTYRYVVADVFTDTPLAGNPVAVFTDGRGLDDGEMQRLARELNLSETVFVFPAEADYERSHAVAGWARLDSCVRETVTEFELPRDERRRIYLSLGSLGSADVELMQRLIDTLAGSDFLVVVSMGPRHDELRLAENMVGAEFLPQPAILPQVDLVITHGGNNTITESLHFAKPTVVLPLFWDQHDNALRMHELGLGRRLDTYSHDPAELIQAIEGLLADAPLADRLGAISTRLQADPGTVRAADLIGRLAETGQRRSMTSSISP